MYVNICLNIRMHVCVWTEWINITKISKERSDNELVLQMLNKSEVTFMIQATSMNNNMFIHYTPCCKYLKYIHKISLYTVIMHIKLMYCTKKWCFGRVFQNTFGSHKCTCNSTRTHSTSTLYSHSCPFKIFENSFKIDEIH